MQDQFYRVQQPVLNFFHKRGNNILLYVITVILIMFIIFPYAFIRDKSLRSEDMKFDSDIIPDENITISLGSLDKQFDSIHGNEIFLQSNPTVSAVVEDGLNASSSSANSASYHVSSTHVTRTSHQDDGGVKHEQIKYISGMTKAEITAAFDKGTDVTFAALNVGDIVCDNIVAEGITTRLHTTNTTIKDQLIELGNGTSGAGAGDAGIVIERGTSDNLFMGWDHDASSFKFSTGSFTGSSSGDLTHTPAALTCGALTASGAIDINATTFDVDASGALTIDSATSIAIGTNADKPIDIDATTLDIDASGALTIDSATSIAIGTNADKPIDIDATTLDIDASGALTIDASDDSNLTVNGSGKDLNIVVSGGGAQTLIASCAGTGANAVQLTASAGGMDITSAGGMYVTTSASNSNINILPNGTGTLALGLDANTKVDVNALAIELDAGSTGIVINSAATIDIDATTGVTLDCTTLSLGATNDSNLTVNGSGKDLNIVVSGGGAQTLIASCAGTGANAVQLTASAGGMDITSAGVMDVTTSASNSDITITPHGTGNVILGKNSQVNLSGIIIPTNSNVTYTIAQLLGGLVLRDPSGSARSDVTPTAAAIVGGLSSAAIGTSFRFVIANTADAAETITLTAGTNVKLSGAMTIAQNKSREFLAVCTNVTGSSEAVSIVSMSASDVLDNVTAGTAAASKALVLDANKDIGTIRNLTIDGEFSDGNYIFDTSGNVSGLGTVGCGTVTASTGVQSTAVARTATDDGTGNGTIAAGTSVVLVNADSDADHIIILPAPVVGNIITLIETSDTGYELRTSTPASIAINGGSGSNAESAIAGAITYVKCVCVSSTKWICSQYDADGDESKVEAAA